MKSLSGGGLASMARGLSSIQNKIEVSSEGTVIIATSVSLILSAAVYSPGFILPFFFCSFFQASADFFVLHTRFSMSSMQ